MPLLVGLLCIAPCLKAILIGTQRVALASWLDVLRSAMTLPIVVLIAVDITPASPSVDSFVQAMVLGNIVGVALICLATWQVKSVGASAGMRTVMRFAAPAYAANVLQYLNYRLDLFLVAYFRDLRQVGLYALAATLTQLVWLISGAVATAVFARVGAAVDEPRRAAEQTATLARTVLVIQFGLALILAVAAQPLLRTLYGTPFEPAASALWLLLPGAVVLGGAAVLSAHVAGLGRPDLNLVGAIAGLIVTVILDLVLIPSAGISGAAIASSASYGATAAVAAFFFVRLTGVPIRALLVIRRSDLRQLRAALRNPLR